MPNNINVVPVNRARFNISPHNGSYSIKSISDKLDRRIDLPKNSKNEYDQRVEPLLLIYFVDKNSTAKNNTRLQQNWKNLYENLEIEKRNPVSYAIIFPSDNEGTGIYRQII